MTGLIFGMVLVGVALILQLRFSGRSLSQVEEDYYVGEKLVNPEEPFDLYVVLKNPGRRFLPYLRVRLTFPKEFTLQVDNTMKTTSEYGGQEVSWSTWLQRAQSAHFRLSASASHRGRYVLDKMKVYGGDVLGFSESCRECKGFHEIIVAPREVPAAQVEPQMGSFLGQISVNRFLHEDPILTVGFREYTGQEPMKRISWGQSARGQGLMVKQYEYTTDPRVVVLLNVEAREAGEVHLENCYSMARTVCRILEDRAIPYRLVTNARFDLLINRMLEKGSGDNLVMESAFGLGYAHFRKNLEILGRGMNKAAFSTQALLEKSLAEDDANCSRILETPENSLPERFRRQSGLLVLTPERGEGE